MNGPERFHRVQAALTICVVLLGCASPKPSRVVVAGMEAAAESGSPKSNFQADADAPPVRTVDFQTLAVDPIAEAAQAESQWQAESKWQPGVSSEPVVIGEPVLIGEPVVIGELALNPPMYDLASLESMASGSHPAIAVARSRVQSVRGRWVQAGLPNNPTAQYQSDEVGNDGASGLHSLQINQTWITANKLGLARSVTAAELERSRAELRRTELRVLTEVRAASIAAMIAQARVDQTRGLLQIARESVQSVQAMLQAGEVSRIALLQTETAADQTEIALGNAVAGREASMRRLAAAVGQPLDPSAQLSGDPVGLLAEMPWAGTVSELVAASPEMSAAGSELDRTRRALSLACAQVTPNVTTQVGVGYDGGTDDTFAVFGVSVPLPLRNRNQGNIASARAEIGVASSAIEQTELSLTSRLAVAMGRYQAARQRVLILDESILPRAEETLELSREAFEAGEANFLELLVSQQTLSQTRLSLLDAAEAAQTAAAQIDGLLVGTLP